MVHTFPGKIRASESFTFVTTSTAAWLVVGPRSRSFARPFKIHLCCLYTQRVRCQVNELSAAERKNIPNARDNVKEVGIKEKCKNEMIKIPL